MSEQKLGGVDFALNAGLCPKPPSIISIVTGAYMGDMKKVVAHARHVADQWDAAGEAFQAKVMRNLCDKIERGEELQQAVALGQNDQAQPQNRREVNDE